MKKFHFLKSPYCIYKILLGILFALLLGGCTGMVQPGQSSVTSFSTLSADQTVGQTFVAKNGGLNGIYFYLTPADVPADGRILLHLRNNPNSAADLAISINSVDASKIHGSAYYGFFIPPQSDSNQKYYYAFLEFKGMGNVQVGNGDGKVYLNGASYQNGSPEDAQTAFQLRYSRRIAFLSLLLESLSWAGILLVGLFLFVLPGWGLFSLAWPGWTKLSWSEKLGLSAGLSLALYPLFLLWTYLIGLHLGAANAWVPPLIGLAIILWRNRRRFNSHRSATTPFRLTGKTILPDAVFLILVALLIFTRFWAIRSLDLPLWGDSYQHTMITQLLVDHRGLFSSWQPYADLTTFTYHFGFHSDVAVFYWITHLETPKAVLWAGQLLNILAILVLYPLAVKVGRNRWAGIMAILVAGLLSPMPMYYTNWGRYTQLAGQVILPVVAWVMWEILSSGQPVESKRANIGRLVTGGLLFGGLALTHYRVLILALIFLIAVWIIYTRRNTWLPMLRNTIWVGLLGGLLFLPWFIRVFGGKILQIVGHQMTTSAVKAIESNPSLTGIGNITAYLPSFLWVVFLFFLGWGLWRQEKSILLIGLWWLGNLLIGNPTWLGLPGANAVSSFTILIATYIPAALFLGAGVSWFDLQRLGRAVSRTWIQKVAFVSAAIVILGLAIYGVDQRRRDVNPSNAIASRPDMMAAMWLDENTPPESVILVNSFFAYGNSVIVGSDGGWWLPLLAHRQITAPPLNYSSEQNISPDYLQRTNALTYAIQSQGIQNPLVLSRLRDRGIGYVFIGQAQGTINSPGPLFTPAQLLADPNFRPVYHQDRVWIFTVVSEP